jgi:hypothetical protein
MNASTRHLSSALHRSSSLAAVAFAHLLNRTLVIPDDVAYRCVGSGVDHCKFRRVGRLVFLSRLFPPNATASSTFLRLTHPTYPPLILCPSRHHHHLHLRRPILAPPITCVLSPPVSSFPLVAR